MKEVKAIIKPFRLDAVLHGLHLVEGVRSVTVSDASGFNAESGSLARVLMSKLEIVVPDGLVDEVTSVIEKYARTGNPGDGRIYILPVEQAVRIRTGERGDV